MLNGDDPSWYAHSQLADLDENDEYTRTAYQDEGAYRRSGKNDNNDNKRTISGRPNKRVLRGAHERKQTKTKQFLSEWSTLVRGQIKRTCDFSRYKTCTRGDPTLGKVLTWHQAFYFTLIS